MLHTGYADVVSGSDIVALAKAGNRYSEFDASEILLMLSAKEQWYQDKQRKENTHPLGK